jgi:hypothetical protein
LLTALRSWSGTIIFDTPPIRASNHATSRGNRPRLVVAIEIACDAIRSVKIGAIVRARSRFARLHHASRNAPNREPVRAFASRHPVSFYPVRAVANRRGRGVLDL